MSCSPPNVEAALSRRSGVLNRCARDVARHVPRHRGEKRLNDVRLALDHQLDLATGQVAHIAGDGIARRQLLSRVTEAHALHTPRVQAALTDNGHKLFGTSAREFDVTHYARLRPLV